MTDVFTPRKRSEIMARIKGRGNLSTEQRFASMLRRARVSGWRRHQLVLGTRPDFVFREGRVVVFVDGCFWHGCGICRDGRIPKGNRVYWKTKIEGNIRRDRIQKAKLRKGGWRVVRIWEHELIQPTKKLQRLVKDLLQ